MTAGTLIIGGGQAGAQIAASLREFGYDAPVTLVGAEAQPPYQRPPLSKAFLAGTADLGSLQLRSASFYAERAIDVLCSERIVRIRLDADGRGAALTDLDRTLEFDRLALAVGARPRHLAVPGGRLGGVCYLRDAIDAMRIRAQLAGARHLVVVGGGFIGLEIAAVARSVGKDVTVVEAADRLIARSVDPLISDFYLQAHRRRAVAVRLGESVTGFAGRRRVRGVRLAGGDVLPADLVVVGVGVVPRTELAEQLGLRCAGGIVVDRYARTSNPAVVAAGDCTVAPNPLTGDGLVRLESMPNAVGQARVAAATLAGLERPYAEVPWFWSDQYDLKLQIAGVPNGYDRTELDGDPLTESFALRYYSGAGLVAVTAVNRPRDYLAVRKALSGTLAVA